MGRHVNRRSAAWLAAVSVLSVGCHDTLPSGPDAPSPAAPLAAKGAGQPVVRPHFFFLPPLAQAAPTTGTFDPTLSPVVEICAVAAGGACAPSVTFTTTGTGSERVRVALADQHYLVNWHTKQYAVDPSARYRIAVRVAALTLGTVEVGDVRGTIPIKFRIEHGAIPAGKPVWKFNIIGAVSKATADYLGGLDAAARLMRAQIDSVNSRFNTPNVFAGEFRFSLDSVYTYTGTGWAEVTRPHPGFAYKYMVDGYQGPGGWLSDFNVVFLSWPIEQITTSGPTDGVVHEFGHARGAIDLYGIKADGIFNPVNGASYHPGRSIMDYPYGETTWDTHSINLINRSANQISAPPSYITEAFPPSIGVVVVDAAGTPQPGATVRMYPVPWFQNRVMPEPRYTLATNAAGEFVFARNPFEPGTPNVPWLMVYPNYLVVATLGTRTGYGWMPMTDVQNVWFANPTAPYRLRVTLSTSVTFAWEAAAQFASTNGGGDWYAGWTASLGSAFVQYPDHRVAAGTESWTQLSIMLYDTPEYRKNTSTATVNTVPPGGVALHPGCHADEYSVLRWSASSAGTYRVQATFFAGDVGNTSAHVLRNGVGVPALFSAASTAASPTYSATLTLGAGETLDFVTGTGGDGCYNDTTPVQVRIELVN